MLPGNEDDELTSRLSNIGDKVDKIYETIMNVQSQVKKQKRYEE